MTHPMAADEFEHLVAGGMVTGTIGQFKLRAARIIESEQAKANPDTALIAFACDAIRLAREHGTFYHTVLDRVAREFDSPASGTCDCRDAFGRHLPECPKFSGTCDCRDAFGRHLPECPKFSGGTVDG